MLKIRMDLVRTSCKGLFLILSTFLFFFFPKWCTWASVVWDENTGTNIPCVHATLHTRAKYVVHLISHFRDMLSSAAQQFIKAVKRAFLWGILLLRCLLAYIINHASPQLGVMTMVFGVLSACYCRDVLMCHGGRQRFYFLHHSVGAIILTFFLPLLSS